MSRINEIPIDEAIRGGNLALKAVADGKLGRTEQQIKQLQASFLMYRKLDGLLTQKNKRMVFITWGLPIIGFSFTVVYLSMALRFHQGWVESGSQILADAAVENVFYAMFFALLGCTRFILGGLRKRTARMSQEYLAIIEEVQTKVA